MLTYISQACQLIARDRTRTRPRAKIYLGVLSSHVQNVIWPVNNTSTFSKKAQLFFCK